MTSPEADKPDPAKTTEVHSPSSSRRLDASDDTLVSRLVLEFESAAGEAQRPRIEDFLERVDVHTRPAALKALLSFAVRGTPDWRSKPTRKECLERFADHRDTVEQVFGPERIGSLQVETILGEGTFGRVYLCRDEALQVLRAVKLPHLNSGVNQSEYIEEARTVAALDHPNIVPVYQADLTDSGTVFVVSKFVDGTDLARRMKAGPVPLTEAVGYVVAAARALHHAHSHERGFVHRDVKPANLLLDDTGRLYVADFGLAVDEQRQRNLAGQFAGSLAYMAPEQVRGEAHRLDGRTDVWALGVVLYELLTGRRPFSGRDVQEFADEIVNRDPRPPRMIDDSIPQRVERVCLSALAKQIGDRPSTALDFANALDAAIRLRPQLEGRVVAGRFRIDKRLPTDETGDERTYSGVELDSKRPVVLRFNPVDADETERLAEYVRRIDWAAHPNLQEILFVGRDPELDDDPVLVKEDVAGEVLEALRDDLNVEQTSAIVVGLAEGLAFLRSRLRRHESLPAFDVDLSCRRLLIHSGDAKVRLMIANIDDDLITALRGPALDDAGSLLRSEADEARRIAVLLESLRTHALDRDELRDAGIRAGSEEADEVWGIGRADVLRRALDGRIHDLAEFASEFGKASQAAMTVVDENVEFAVYRPRSVKPEEWTPLLAFAYRGDDGEHDEPTADENRAEVERQAVAGIGEVRIKDYSPPVTQVGDRPIPRDGELSFVPRMDGVEFDPPHHAFVWERPVHRSEFQLKAAATLLDQTARGRMSVYLGGLLVAELTMTIRVTQTESNAQANERERVRPFRKIFASFAEEDVRIVGQVRRLAAVLGDRVTTRSHPASDDGTDDDRVGHRIEEADVFQLFWSGRSMTSPLVQEEWRHASSLGREEFIRPVYWERPFPRDVERDLPPPELARLHFEDIGDLVAEDHAGDTPRELLPSRRGGLGQRYETIDKGVDEISPSEVEFRRKLIECRELIARALGHNEVAEIALVLDHIDAEGERAYAERNVGGWVLACSRVSQVRERLLALSQGQLNVAGADREPTTAEIKEYYRQRVEHLRSMLAEERDRHADRDNSKRIFIRCDAIDATIGKMSDAVDRIGEDVSPAQAHALCSIALKGEDRVASKIRFLDEDLVASEEKNGGPAPKRQNLARPSPRFTDSFQLDPEARRVKGSRGMLVAATFAFLACIALIYWMFTRIF